MHQHGVFVTAKSIQVGIIAADFADDTGDFLDRAVAYHMAVMIVDDLEPVEIDDGQRNLML